MRCNTWPKLSPPPIGGMPWRSTHSSKFPGVASSRRQASVPRRSPHITTGPVGAPSARTGTVDEY